MTFPNNLPRMEPDSNHYQGVCMAGNISTDEKCSVCGGKMIHDENRRVSGCFCLVHTQVAASGQFRVRFGRKINKRFQRYDRAYQFLNGLRFEKANGKLDARDYMYSKPLGFANLGKKYLDFKEEQNLTGFYHIKRYIKNATEYFEDTNVKDIRKKDIRKFLKSLKKTIKDENGKDVRVPLADKTKALHCSQLHDMYHNFLYEEEEILNLAQLPKFPKVEYELGFRKLIDIGTREQIVDRLKEMTYPHNPKIWLGVDMLCAYAKIRPLDLRRLKEGDIDLDQGFATFWRPSKTKKNKAPKVVSIKLLDYHVEEIRKLKKVFPATGGVLFFRHPENSRFPNMPLGKDQLYRHWKKACKEFGIEDLDLYGGTRHSSTTAIGKAMGKTRARDFSGHDTNEAFDRYCQIGEQDDFDISQLMAKMRGKVVDFKPAKGGEI